MQFVCIETAFKVLLSRASLFHYHVPCLPPHDGLLLLATMRRFIVNIWLDSGLELCLLRFICLSRLFLVTHSLDRSQCPVSPTSSNSALRIRSCHLLVKSFSFLTQRFSRSCNTPFSAVCSFLALQRRTFLASSQHSSTVWAKRFSCRPSLFLLHSSRWLCDSPRSPSTCCCLGDLFTLPALSLVDSDL